MKTTKLSLEEKQAILKHTKEGKSIRAIAQARDTLYNDLECHQKGRNH